MPSTPSPRAILGERDLVAIVLAVGATVVLLVMAALGRFAPVEYPDTVGYLTLGGFPENLGGLRNPLYGWLVAALTEGSGIYDAIPLVQILLYIASVVVLAKSLRALGMGTVARLSVGLPLLIANPLLLYGNGVHPELPAIAFLLLGLACSARAVAGRRPVLSVIGVGVAVSVAYFLRPSFLPFIAAAPVLVLAWSALYGRLRPRLAMACFAACLVPFLGFSAMRQAEVGDFNVVSFGGFQMAGMAAILLTPDVVDRLPADVAPTARTLLADYDVAVGEGRVPALPRNSSGQRSYVSVALGYFDVIARMHDDVLYGVVDRLRQPGENWVGYNRRMQRLAVSTVLAAPDRYAVWVIGATTRFVGRALVANAAFMLAFIALAGVFIVRVFRPTLAKAKSARDAEALIVLVAAYTLGAGALAVLTTFPAARYVDTAGILLGALPVYGLLSLLGQRGKAPGGR